MKTQRHLDDVFASAASESSSLTEKDVALIITKGNITKGSNRTMITIASVAAAAAAGIISFFVSLPTPVTEPKNDTSISIERGSVEKMTHESPVPASPSTSQHARKTSDARYAISVVSLNEGDISQLDMDPLFVSRLQRVISSVDSMRYCDAKTTQVTICAWQDGTVQQIPLSHGTDIQPVMFTDKTGRGQFVIPQNVPSIDVNSLIPVETESEHGSMLLWYPPTLSLLKKLPEEIAAAMTAHNVEADEDVVLNHVIIDSTSSMPNIDSLIQAAIMASLPSLGDVTITPSDLGSMPTNMNRVIDSLMKKVMKERSNNGMTVHALTFSDSLKFNLPEGVKSPRETKRVVGRSNIFILKQPKKGSKSQGHLDRTRQKTDPKNGALTVESVFPNPVVDHSTTLSLLLEEPRVLAVALHDITGQRLHQLQSPLPKDAGRVELLLPINNVQPGMYLLHVTTDAGETVVRRLVVQ